MKTAKNITVIPATLNKRTGLPTKKAYRRRVAAYARVSTDSEEQQTSYEAQVDYYTQYIRSKPEWEFVGVYTDEGISATNTKKRDGFIRKVSFKADDIRRFFPKNYTMQDMQKAILQIVEADYRRRQRNRDDGAR